MTDVYRTMILDAADAPLGRSIANMFAGSDQHMWQTGISADGKAPATHYISTGYVPEGYQIIAPWQVIRYGYRNAPMEREARGE